MHPLCPHCFLIVGSGSFYCSSASFVWRLVIKDTQSWQWKPILMSSKPNDGLPIIYNDFLNSTLIILFFRCFNAASQNCTFCSSLELTVQMSTKYHDIKFTYSPVVLQWASGEGTFVGGILVFPAPAQNQPFTLMGCKCSASHPLPLKLHFRPEV